MNETTPIIATMWRWTIFVILAAGGALLIALRAKEMGRINQVERAKLNAIEESNAEPQRAEMPQSVLAPREKKLCIGVWPGEEWTRTHIKLAGIPIAAPKDEMDEPVPEFRCPLTPSCSFSLATDDDLGQFDVLIIGWWTVTDVQLRRHPSRRAFLKSAKKKYPGQVRVLYWREAVPHAAYEAQAAAELTMGIRFDSTVLNPSFAIPLSVLAQRGAAARTPFPYKRGFAMSMISNCGANSGRDEYIAELKKYMPIDLYGACAPGWDSDAPAAEFADAYDQWKRMIKRAPKGVYSETTKLVVSSYKFYLSFENTIADGYVTEKFWMPLRMGTVPVYYGAPGNVKRLGFTDHLHAIEAADFGSPRELASFLLLLGSSEQEYEAYHAWRKQRFNAATKSWEMPLVSARYVSRIALGTPSEDEARRTRAAARPFPRLRSRFQRVAATCRFCQPEFLRRALAAKGAREKENPWPPAWTRNETRARFGC